MTASDSVAKWLASLGVLCAGTMPTEEARTRIAAFAPTLAEDFAPGYFTRDSMRYVASKCRFFPSYAEVCEHLKAWRSERNFGMPSAPLSDAPQIEGPTRSGRARPRVTILELVEHEMGLRPLRWTDYGVYPHTPEERAAAEADVRTRLEYRRTMPPPAETVRLPKALRDVTLKGQALAEAREQAGITSPDPRIRASVALAHAVAPAMRAAAQREREAAE